MSEQRQAARIVSLAAAMIIACTGFPLSAESQSYVPNQVLVRFVDNAASSCRDSALASVRGAIVDSLSLVGYFVVELADTSVIAAIAELDSQYCVHAVQTNGRAFPDSFPLLSPNDTHYSLLNHLQNTGQDGGSPGADIDAEGGWAFINDAQDVVIAIMDTGVDYYHEDLAGNVWTNAGEIGTDGNGQNKQANGADDCRTADGTDVTESFRLGGGRVFGAGEDLVITLPEVDGVTHLVLEAAAAPAPADVEPGGIDAQRQGPDGTWQTIGQFVLRRQMHRSAVELGGAREVRLVAVRPAEIRSLTGLAQVEVKEPTWLEPSAVKSGGVDRMRSFVAEGQPLVLEQADDVVLTFPVERPGEGVERSVFFYVESRSTSGGGFEPAVQGASVGEPAFSLGLARPNPSFGSVTFNYTLPGEMLAQLRIYDAAGRLVRTLDQRLRPAGRHEAIWDRRSETGRKASPGVYFYRLEAGGHRSERKLIVLPG